MSSTQFNFGTFAAKQSKAADFAVSPVLAQQACTPSLVYRHQPASAVITGAMMPFSDMRPGFYSDSCGLLDAPQYIPSGAHRAVQLESFPGVVFGFSHFSRDFL